MTLSRPRIHPEYPGPTMFDALAEKLQSALGDLRGGGVLERVRSAPPAPSGNSMCSPSKTVLV